MKRHMTNSRGLVIRMALVAMLATVASSDVTEDFVRSDNSNIDSTGELNESPRAMENTGFTWGGFANAGTTAVKGRDNDKLFFKVLTNNTHIHF